MESMENGLEKYPNSSLLCVVLVDLSWFLGCFDLGLVWFGIVHG